MEILMATYNGAAFLSAQLDSILSQDTECWHLTVSDDGSTDETPKILDDYVRQFPQKITRVFSGRHFGNARDHFFWLMNQCKADYMHFSDQDDIWHPDKVRKIQQTLEKAEERYGRKTPLLVFTDQTVVDERLHPIAASLMQLQKQNPEKTDYRNILFQNIVTGCTMAINRSLADFADRCMDKSRVIMHDWWLALVAARFGKLIYLNETTLDYRQHEDNSVGAKNVHDIGYVAKKLAHISELKEFFVKKKTQAALFKDTFSELLTDEDIELLTAFSAAQSNLVFKCSYERYIFGFLRKVGFFCLW